MYVRSHWLQNETKEFCKQILLNSLSLRTFFSTTLSWIHCIKAPERIRCSFFVVVPGSQTNKNVLQIAWIRANYIIPISFSNNQWSVKCWRINSLQNQAIPLDWDWKWNLPFSKDLEEFIQIQYIFKTLTYSLANHCLVTYYLK